MHIVFYLTGNSCKIKTSGGCALRATLCSLERSFESMLIVNIDKKDVCNLVKNTYCVHVHAVVLYSYRQENKIK